MYKKSQLNRPEFNVAIGLAKRNAWIGITKGKETMLELDRCFGENPIIFDGVVSEWDIEEITRIEREE